MLVSMNLTEYILSVPNRFVFAVSYVKMDDISHGLTKPYILDVKIGAQCWSHDAPVNKQQRQKLRCPHLDDIRFQILGAKVSTA